MINEKLELLQSKIEAIEAQLEDNIEILYDNEFYILYDELMDLCSIIQNDIYLIPLSELSEVSKELLSEDLRRFNLLEKRIDKIKDRIIKEDETDIE